MKYCTTCLQPDTRPNSRFTDTGQCPACVYFDQLALVDWQERHEILLDLLEGFRRPPGRYFDCLVGVSGGKDSTRQALYVRDKLGLRPLLVCLSYPPQQVTPRGVDNISNMIDSGFDLVMSAPAPDSWRRLMRLSFDRFTNWARSTELALFTSVPQIAIRYQVPLILWGENPGLQVGDMGTLGRTGYDGNNIRFGNTLGGGQYDWMQEAGVPPGNLLPYQYPAAEAFDAAQIQIVYLGWFLGDWSFINNAAYSCASGLEKRDDDVSNTGDLLGVSSLDEDWVTLNQMIKYYKFGFGKVTEYVNEELRLKRMDRATAIRLCEQYDGACADHYIESFCEFIDISVDTFWEKVRASCNRQLFDVRPDGRIERRFVVGEGL